MSTQTAKAKAAPKRAAQAAAEKAPDRPDTKTVEFEGLTLTIPADIPAVLLFDIAEVEATSESNPMPMIRLLRSLLGPEQFTQVRHRIPTGEGDWTAVYSLLDKCMSQYGLSVGEAEASQS